MKGLFSISDEQLRNLNVESKFKKVFGRILTATAVAVGALVITLIVSLNGLMSMYKSYQIDNVQGEIRIDIQALSKAFLWAMASTDDAIREENYRIIERQSSFVSEFKKLSYNGK